MLLATKRENPSVELQGSGTSGGAARGDVRMTQDAEVWTPERQQYKDGETQRVERQKGECREMGTWAESRG